VSLYNETDGKAIKPTPMIAMVGLLDDVTRHAATGFAAEGHVVALLGEVAGSLGGSEYLERIAGVVGGAIPRLDAARHRPVFDAIRQLVAGGLVASAHDISEGGLLVAVAECCLAAHPHPLGAALEIPATPARLDQVLFGEGPARFVISFAPERAAEVEAACAAAGAPLTRLGETGGRALEATLPDGAALRVSLEEADAAWRGGFAAVAG
jgi:phosphoribosylformylglycinamidine synthase subunit PurL